MIDRRSHEDAATDVAISPATLGRLLQLGRSRWFVPLLAAMAPRGGARVAEMRHRFGLSASMARRTLGAMVEAGWITPNPGHGHPLRPDYLLSELGRALAPHAQALVEERELRRLPTTGLGKWHLPLLVALGNRPTRFNTLEARLSPVTPRALSLQLKRSVEAQTVLRIVQPAYPPVALYRVNDQAVGLRDRAVAIAAT